MARNELLKDITNIIEGYGFEYAPNFKPMTYQKSVKYSGLIENKMETAHFLLFTNTESIQITAKWQEVGGTTIEKLGYTVLDAARTEHGKFWVVCGGNKLVTKAIDFLNSNVSLAPKLKAMDVETLELHLLEVI
ncbi:hypothetical protein EAG18_07120 [Pseudoalteromonas sp. J010]|uniref:PD-(D/E)XK nuclease superfamily protein n=1 Tax=Pseudoalteromonas TaxID=53246 RepID=UPI000F65310E|nr:MULTISPECIES: PD-(D/E)XK nuclease superfamily protein [Pseudoalteromonas]MDW7549140.1 PD-(D/E)XK nuclease superfamily protein [Pseudoalteromonas peptidolytica]RRS09207.1 hypothetical protein EAG18_07120 [Pseudoalteromonas sp. J010]